MTGNGNKYEVILRMSDSDDQYEVPSGGNDGDCNKVEVSVTEINEEKELDAESKNKGKNPNKMKIFPNK